MAPGVPVLLPARLPSVVTTKGSKRSDGTPGWAGLCRFRGDDRIDSGRLSQSARGALKIKVGKVVCQIYFKCG